MSTPADIHAEVRNRLPYYALGLLEESEENRLRAHLDSCEQCRAELDNLHDDDSKDEGHLPESWVVDWERRSRSLEGLQRELTRRHLAECSSCRDLIRDFGHEPELPRVEALEANEAVMALLPEVAEASPLPAPKVVRPAAAFWRRWEVGFLAGGSLVAAAAAFLFVMSPTLRGPAPGVISPEAPPPSIGIAMQPGAPQFTAFAPGAGEVRAGGDAADTTFVLAQDQRTLRVLLPQDFDIPIATVVEVQLLTMQSGVLDHFATTYGDLLGGERGLTLVSASPLEPGRFVVRLTWLLGDGSTRKQADYFVELRR